MTDNASTVNGLSAGAVAILVLAAIVLVTIAIIGGFSEVLRTRTNTSLNNFNVSEVGDIVQVNGTDGEFPFLQKMTNCINGTVGIASGQAFATNLFTTDKGNADGGTFTLLAAGTVWNNTYINCSNFEYLADTDSQESADNFATGVAIFGSFAAVLILALIGLAIVRLFQKKD